VQPVCACGARTRRPDLPASARTLQSALPSPSPFACARFLARRDRPVADVRPLTSDRAAGRRSSPLLGMWQRARAPGPIRHIGDVDWGRTNREASVTKECVRTDKAPSSPYYSQAVKAAGLVFVSGQGPLHPQTGEVVGETIQEQVRQCLRNVSEILSAAG